MAPFTSTKSSPCQVYSTMDSHPCPHFPSPSPSSQSSFSSPYTLSSTPLRRVDPRTKQILQGIDATPTKVQIGKSASTSPSSSFIAEVSKQFNENEDAVDIALESTLDDLSPKCVTSHLEHKLLIQLLDLRRMLAMGRSQKTQACENSGSERLLSLPLEETASPSQLLENINQCIDEAPWKVNAPMLIQLKKAMQLSLGQLIEIILSIIVDKKTERVVAFYSKNSGYSSRYSSGYSSRSGSNSSEKQNSLSDSSKETFVILLQDFNWTDHGFPVIEAFGLDEVAKALEAAFETGQRLALKTTQEAKQEWIKSLKEVGVEDEEEVEMEIVQKDVGEYGGSLDQKLLQLVQVEAEHNAIMLHMLKAMSGLLK